MSARAQQPCSINSRGVATSTSIPESEHPIRASGARRPLSLPSIARYTAITVVITYLAIILFPRGEQPATAGLDGSWIMALNNAPYLPYLFGVDLYYTYGPLGFLTNPLPYGHNILLALLFRLVYHSVFILSLTLLALSQRSIITLVMVAFVFVLAKMFGLSPEYQAQLSACVALALTASGSRLTLLGWAFAGGMAGVLPFVKIGGGIVVMLGLLLAAGVTPLLAGFRNWRGPVLGLATFAATFLALAGIFMRTPERVITWFDMSSEIARGYGVAMSVTWPPTYVPLGLAAVAVALVALCVAMVRDREQIPAYLGLLILVVASFKHGYVRNPAFFFPTCFATLAILLLRARSDRDRSWYLGAVLATLTLAIPVATGVRGGQGWLHNGENVITAYDGLRALEVVYNRSGVTSQLRAISDANMARQRLPAEWIAPIKESQASVDVIPWELSFIPANDLNWTPNPVGQTFMAYSPKLDRATGEHFSAAGSPDYLLVDFIDLAAKNPIISTPNTWKSILSHYELRALLPKEEQDKFKIGIARQLAMFKQSNQVLNFSSDITGEDVYNKKASIMVPGSQRGQIVELHFKLSTLGNLVGLLFHVPPVSGQVARESGRVDTFGVVLDSLQNGFLINPLPWSLDDVRALRSGGIRWDPVRSIQFSGAGLDYYEESVRVVWRETVWIPPR